jgi:hypothetical protein
VPLVDNLMIADLDRADFGYPIAGRPTARRLDVDHDVILLGIEAVVDPPLTSRYYVRSIPP